MAGRLITPPSLPAETRGVTVTLPDGNQWIAPFLGAIYFLSQPGNWESLGGVSPEDTAAVFAGIYAVVSDQWEAG